MRPTDLVHPTLHPIEPVELGHVRGGLFGGALLRGLGRGVIGAGKLAGQAVQSGAVGDIIRAAKGGGGGGAASSGGCGGGGAASSGGGGGGGYDSGAELGGTSVSVSVRFGR